MTIAYRAEQTACAFFLAAAGVYTAATLIRHHAAGAVIAMCDAGSDFVLERVRRALEAIEPWA